MEFHLGCGFGGDKDETLCLNPKQCVEKMLETFKDSFGELPQKRDSPSPPNDHPEMDVSELLEDDNVEKHLSLVGQLQWAVSLGRWDIQTAVMTMSSFRVAPRPGHLDELKHICGHLRKFPHQKIRFRTDPPDLTAFDNSKDHSWAVTACKEDPEVIPSDAPEELGEELALTHCFDANLMHDVVTERAATGCLHLLNKTPIHSHSKKQGSVETATFGAEFSAAGTCMEQVIDLRCTLRHLGVNPGKVSHTFGDNKAMVDCAKHPDAGINKRHTILSFHCVRSLAARGFLAMNHTVSGSNAVDTASEHWAHESAWSLIKPLFNHEGDTGELHMDDVKSDSSSSESGALKCSHAEIQDKEMSKCHWSPQCQDVTGLVGFCRETLWHCNCK